jgi:hypothetical protein
MDNCAAGSINRNVREQPSVVSERMVFRPLTEKNAPAVRRLALQFPSFDFGVQIRCSPLRPAHSSPPGPQFRPRGQRTRKLRFLSRPPPLDNSRTGVTIGPMSYGFVRPTSPARTARAAHATAAAPTAI